MKETIVSSNGAQCSLYMLLLVSDQATIKTLICISNVDANEDKANSKIKMIKIE